jgi:twitching motility protein PilT
MAKVEELLRMMKAQSASDLHLVTGSPPFLRIHGEMVKLKYKPVSEEVCHALIFEILSEKQRALFKENLELDLGYSLEGVGRFRVNVFLQRKGIGAVFRLIPQEIQTIEELGLPNQVLDLIDVREGLILVTGPTGSGKSTTLASLIQSINKSKTAHIITIEDPIEFIHVNELSLINQREVASHTHSFSNALRAALREDPDIILVGETRDLETMSLAITAAETGHLVFATLHTNNAVKTVDRVIDVFPEGQQAQIRSMLSESLRGIVAQTLLPRADGKGRVAAVEILVNTTAVSNLIREEKIFQIQSTMQTGQAQGMVTFETSINELIKKGLVTREDGHTYLSRRAAGRITGVGSAPAFERRK